ncbi:hypothetical protein [Streptomyces sp. NPDC059816]|uniref:hypothetical protein n=1 Tax=Streptomyces sp. NPDC059816 TaxID=3346960 RepID=UPI003650988C
MPRPAEPQPRRVRRRAVGRGSADRTTPAGPPAARRLVAARDAVLANAAGALAARTPDTDPRDAFANGLESARDAIDTGTAAKPLDRWMKLAQPLASHPARTPRHRADPSFN